MSAATTPDVVSDRSSNEKSSSNSDRSSSGSIGGVLSTWKKQLITREDPFHLHKTLGVSCLLSFIWRLSQAGNDDMGFATHPAWTIPTILLHWSLTLSAFVFKIPMKRIKSGDRIWPEYRLHALVFLSRSLAILCVYHYEKHYKLEKPLYDCNFVIVMATLYAADVSSWSVGDHRSPTIRELDAHPAVHYFFSVMQLSATTSCLCGPLPRRSSLMFFMVLIVQVNPFLMTIRRKNLLSKNDVVSIYGMGLVASIVAGAFEYCYYAPKHGVLYSYYCQNLIASLAALLRLGPRLPILRYVQDNKYVMWLLLGLLLRQVLRPMFDQPVVSPFILAVCVGARLATVVLGIWKGWLRDYYQQRQRVKME